MESNGDKKFGRTPSHHGLRLDLTQGAHRQLEARNSTGLKSVSRLPITQ